MAPRMASLVNVTVQLAFLFGVGDWTRRSAGSATGTSHGSLGAGWVGPGRDSGGGGGWRAGSSRLPPPPPAAIWNVTFALALPTTTLPAASFTARKPPADRTLTSHVFMNGEPQLAEPEDDG